jgi:hypothetical protein
MAHVPYLFDYYREAYGRLWSLLFLTSPMPLAPSAFSVVVQAYPLAPPR